jgi:hypothetical protein
MFMQRLSVLTGCFLVGNLMASEPSKHFGFVGPEVFPIDFGVGFLRCADFDGDGLIDLVVVNNARSKITFLFNQTGVSKEEIQRRMSAPGRREPNELPPDSRFRIDSIASEKRISSFVVDDFNGSGRPDLAYYGEPKELILQHNLGTNGWSAPRKYDLNDGLTDMNALASGDLDGDGLADLVLLAERHLYILRQQKDGTLSEPEKLPYTGIVKAVQIVDIDGDGRNDLLLVNWDHLHPFRVRRQDAHGNLRPEIHLPLAPIRSYWAADLDGNGKTEIITIAAKSGRAAVSRLRQVPAEPVTDGVADGQFSVVPLPRTDKARRGIVWSDLNGDGLPDLIVADPDGGQLMVHRRDAGGRLIAAQAFPTLSGVSDLAVADWDNDGLAEVFLLSGDEKQIGLARTDETGRLAFPRPMPLPGRPLAMALGNLHADKMVLASVVEREEKRTREGREETFMVRELALVAADGELVVQTLSEDYKGIPSVLGFHDVDQDGLMDILILTPYERIKILRQLSKPVDGRVFSEIDVNPPGGNTDRPWMARADVDQDGKPELLLAQKNFVRAVVLRPDNARETSWNLVVLDQINGSSSSSRIVGAAALPPGRGDAPTLFLLDADRKALTVSVRDTNGVWQPRRNISLPVTEYTALDYLDMDPDSDSVGVVVLTGVNGVAWKELGGEVWELAELDGYETPIKDGYLNDVTSGDLNGDGRQDLVFLETRKAHLDLVLYEAPNRLVAANRWQVFEERTFRQRRSLEVAEPREAIVVDLTGDGQSDLAILVHDRILVYPQE